MPRRVSWGTPGRTERYLWPRPPRTLTLIALGAGAVVLAALGLLAALGRTRPLAPGGLIGAHALVEARCQECHGPGVGASDIRCQRCHDAAGGGRLTHASHVLFGSGDASRAGAAPEVACARCHVEHRGREARLAEAPQAQCAACHFRRLGAHPEFAVLRSPPIEATGLVFPHVKHMASLQRERGLTGDAACGECHERDRTARDFAPLSFERHCASCHASTGSLGTVAPLPDQDALSPLAIQALGVEGDWLQRADEYELGRGRVGKATIRHRDEWVVFNLHRLRRELMPEAHGAERARELARLSQLERRLALATPLAGMSAAALETRAAALDAELRGIDARLAAQPAAGEAATALARLGEVAAAAAAGGEAPAAAEMPAAALGDPAAALPAGELETRRGELLALLEALEAADPALAPRAEDLRRRLLALRGGETSAELLGRLRRQRMAERARVEDERRLRQAGLPPPPPAMLASEQAALRRAMAEAQRRLEALSLAPPAEAPLDEETRTRKLQSAAALTEPCAKCHLVERLALRPVRAARPVLVRSEFRHEPHLLQADCARCHPGVAASTQASDLNIRGVASCRECHQAFGATQACQDCHAYHPQEAP